MKKQGFTLAEVLITLGIVGVIAAITLPTFVASNQDRANETKLAASVSAIENALTTMLAKEAETDLTETTWAEQGYSVEQLSNFLKIDTPEGAGAGEFTLKNGTVATFEAGGGAAEGSIGSFILDANGDKKPNREGKDIAIYDLMDTGAMVLRNPD